MGGGDTVIRLSFSTPDTILYYLQLVKSTASFFFSFFEVLPSFSTAQGPEQDEGLHDGAYLSHDQALIPLAGMMAPPPGALPRILSYLRSDPEVAFPFQMTLFSDSRPVGGVDRYTIC